MAMNLEIGTAPLKACLATIKLGDKLADWIVAREELWASFGKMNSHQYRKDLMKRFESAEMTGEERFMVYFLFSVIKNKDRVVKSLDNMSEDEKKEEWFNKVRSFIDSNLEQYVTQAAKKKKFPAVNIPVTNPGLDILCWLLHSPVEEHTLTMISYRTTFTQIHLSAELQDYAHEGYRAFWDETVTRTKNPDATNDKNFEAPEYKEAYYLTSAADKYPLVFVDMSPWLVQEDEGYDLVELYMYMAWVDLWSGKISSSDVVKRKILLPPNFPFPEDDELRAVQLEPSMYLDRTKHRATKVPTDTGKFPVPFKIALDIKADEEKRRKEAEEAGYVASSSGP